MKKSETEWIDTVKAKPIVKITLDPEPVSVPESIKNILGSTMNKFKSLTFKSVLVIVLVAVIRAILGIWFPDSTVNDVIGVITKILEAVGISAVGTAAWGIRRAVE